MANPSPFVYWAQTDKCVSLKIDLRNVTNPDLNVVDNKIKFVARGSGAHGENVYQFSLDLFSPLKPNSEEETKIVRLYENRVEVVLKKETTAWWPRLTAQPQKPAWLKINFDLWKSEDAQDSEDTESEVEMEKEKPQLKPRKKEVETRDVMKDYPDMYDILQKEEIGYSREEFRRVYLSIYNFFQFVGFMLVLIVMIMRYAKSGYDSLPETYQHVGAAMKFLQLMMYLEVLHPLFGYTKGGALVPFMQVSGRAFILFVMIEAEPRMQTKPVVFYLFLLWSTIEVVRYPYYITQLYKKEFCILTWLRYSMWIPLYPLGVLCESIVILRNIPYFEETQRFTISMPNEWNFAFHMPSFLRVYLLVLTIPGLYFVMSHMLKLRTVKLKPRIVIKKCK